MSDYYSNKLFASHLKKCYDIALPRIQQYLKAEVQFVLDQLAQTDRILELGCGYGRVLAQIAPKVLRAYGIDISVKNLELGKEYLNHLSNIELFEMNVTSIKFEDNSFDHTIAIQNGGSAFQVDPVDLIKESLRVTKIGGKVFLSSYSKNIWEDRLEWFILQSQEGLLGEIDLNETGNGVIVCKDGFKATTLTQEDFSSLITQLKLNARIEEIDQSSLFCVITKV